jgi:anthranilate synthase/aminodeoxychorismate synthase-like glutamine amidotransferase
VVLLIDNYDSFTYNLKDYFMQLGEEVIVVKNDEINAGLNEYRFDKIVISPGPNTPSEAGKLMEVIPTVYDRYPVLGICLGHQALGQFFGSELILAKRPMHGKVSAITHDGDLIYKNIPDPLNVCRYHSLVLRNAENAALRVTASTSDGECMSFRHKTLPITGIQYHPEAILTEHGLKILGNWLETISAPASSQA